MAGVYISYPFCAQKCTYCNFSSEVAAAGEKDSYTESLLQEVARHRWLWHPDTVYWGGGTPSLMPGRDFRQVMRLIPSSGFREVTVECAPGTLQSELLEVWLETGVNRVSLGVQSFVAKEAARTGRRHTAETVTRDLELLRRAGITNVNVDLIAGLPGQTMESLRESLGWVRRLDVPHASVYLFEVDEDSRLGREALLGGVRYGADILPDDDVAASFYQTAVEELGSFGLARYEISNFARPGYESKHNLKYWQRAPYVGFGADAHSFNGAVRWQNSDRVTEYIAHVQSGSRPVTEYADSEQEHFFVGLRQMAGIEPTQSEWRRFSAGIQRGLDTGVLHREGAKLRLTDAGVLVSNELFQDFV